jgi:NADPH-dependent curcumin reductase CurA
VPGLRTHALVDGFRLVRPPSGVPLSAYLGILGATSLTAWVGLTAIAGLRAGESVLITAAGGAVGMAAGYISRALGASRIVGVTGSREKADRLLAGPFDQVIVYPDVVLREALGGLEVDVALEGVGGEQLEAVIDAMAERGRISWVGAISQYNDPASRPRHPATCTTSSVNSYGSRVIRCATTCVNANRTNASWRLSWPRAQYTSTRPSRMGSTRLRRR